MRGFVDLHLHVVPNVDDGVRSYDDSFALLRGLRALGFESTITTPHIRADMFPNRREPLMHAFDALVERAKGDASLPRLGLGAEHWVDETLLDRVLGGEAIPYPGDRAILVEVHPSAYPLGFPTLCFRLQAKKVLPVLAHPERYASSFASSAELAAHHERGVALLLDLMSLVGRYGRAPQRAAERILDEGLYDAACSDAHGPNDLAHVERALVTLERRVGGERTLRLLREGPANILAGVILR